MSVFWGRLPVARPKYKPDTLCSMKHYFMKIIFRVKILQKLFLSPVVTTVANSILTTLIRVLYITKIDKKYIKVR